MLRYVYALDITNKQYLICDNMGNHGYRLSEEEFKHIESKIVPFYSDKVGIIKDGITVRNSLTLLGKYYKGRNKDIMYLLCDCKLNKYSMSKSEIQCRINQVSNVVISKDGRLLMKGVSVPFVDSKSNVRNTDTVVKLGVIVSGTPGSLGVGRKFLGKRVKDSKIGCVKFSLFTGSYDLDNEVLAYELGKLLDIDVAEASIETFGKERCAISVYNYNSMQGNIQSLKSCIGIDNFHAKFNKNWFMQNKSVEAWNKFLQMVMLDLIMHQTDRHISNIAFKGKQLYSLYDNGRALFYDDFWRYANSINLNSRASIVESFHTNEHGYGWMYLEDVIGYENYKHLIKHGLQYEDFSRLVNKCYNKSDTMRNRWTAEYMYKVYCILTRNEKGLW